jgi:uncharacterized phage protein gp47/JayE
VGALVRTADGSQTFAVSLDTAQAAWSADSNGYIIAAGITALDVPVVAQVPGVAGNVQAGTISLLASALPGVDTVANANATQNGIDAESDDAFRSRFVNFIASRSRATVVAVEYAVGSLQQGLSYAIEENVDNSGAARMGSFVVTLDDGSGSPPPSLLSTAQQAIDAVRPIGSIFSVRPPVMVNVDVSLTITVSPGSLKAPIQSSVGAAIGSFINSLPIGEGLPLTRLAQIAYTASSSVANVSQIIANGSAVDIAPAARSVIKARTIAVN